LLKFVPNLPEFYHGAHNQMPQAAKLFVTWFAATWSNENFRSDYSSASRTPTTTKPLKKVSPSPRWLTQLQEQQSDIPGPLF